MSQPPEGAAPWRQRPQRGGRAGNLFFTVLARSGRIGLLFVPFFLFWVALYFVLAAPAARRASCELARRLGHRWALGRLWFSFRHFYGFGRLIAERLAILGGNAHLFRFDSEGREHLLAALEGGHGAVLLTGHIGAWEVMAQVLQGVAPRVSLVMHDAAQAQLRETLEEMAQGRAFRVLWSDGSPAAAAAILAALREGDLVGMMGDRVLSGRTVRAPFLGGHVELPIGPYALAVTAKAPVVHAFAVRTGFRRYGFFAFPGETLAFANTRDKEPDLERWAASFAARLEEFLRQYPHQWGNLFPFWVEEAAP